MNIGNNGLYDLLFYSWINLGIGGDDGMEIITRDGDAPGGYIPPWLSGLSSDSCIVVIKGSRYCLVFVSLLFFDAFRYTGRCDGCHGCGG